jgi:hypothetical protein
MLLVNRWVLGLFALAAIAALIGVGAAGYRSLAVPSADPVEMRLTGEMLLFTALACAAGLLLIGGVLLFRGHRILRELSRIAELSRAGATAVEERLRRLGRLGESILRILVQTTELNRRYALKVSTLSTLNDFLLNNQAQRMIVVDASGKVIGASRGYRETEGKIDAQLVQRDIGKFLEGQDFTAIYGRLDRSRSAFTSAEDPRLHFVPIDNRAGEVACVVCVLGDKPVLSEAPAVAPAGRRRLSVVGRFFRRHF